MSKTKNHYFKHFINASEGASLRSLIDECDWETYGSFWILLELVARWEKWERRGYVEVSIYTIARELNMRPSKCKRVLNKIRERFEWDLNYISDTYVSYLVPNFAEYQGSRFKKSPYIDIDIDKDIDLNRVREEKSGNKLPFEKEKIHDLLDQTKTGRQEVSKAMKAWKLKTGI
jgi:hypothetical protein